MGKRSAQYTRLAGQLQDAMEELEAMKLTKIVKAYHEQMDLVNALSKQLGDCAKREAEKDKTFCSADFGDVFHFDLTPRREGNVQALLDRFGDPKHSDKSIEERAVMLARKKGFKGVFNFRVTAPIGQIQSAIKSELLPKDAEDCITSAGFSFSLKPGPRPERKDQAA